MRDTEVKAEMGSEPQIAGLWESWMRGPEMEGAEGARVDGRKTAAKQLEGEGDQAGEGAEGGRRTRPGAARSSNTGCERPLEKSRAAEKLTPWASANVKRP
jgi:hypothetical protein